MKKRPSFQSYLQELAKHDPEVYAEVQDDAALTEAVGGRDAGEPQMTQETIVLFKGRPVLDVKDNEVVVEINEVESQIWKTRLKDSAGFLKGHIPAVGRIELVNHPRGVDWIGTGWLIRDNIVVTNRHVAEIFGHLEGGKFVFRPGFDGGQMGANVDFVEEFDNTDSLEFPAYEIMHIEHGAGPDIAFLRIQPIAGSVLPKPVASDSTPAKEHDQIAVIGYPARDPFFPDQAMMDRIFNSRYDKKRLAPGLVTGTASQRLFHDCSTLGGNSGGEVVSLKTGKAVALHFAGTLFTKNHAVPIDVVHQRLDDVLLKRPTTLAPVENQPVVQQSRPVTSGGAQVIEATIPINIRVSIGDVSIGGTTVSSTPSVPSPHGQTTSAADPDNIPDDDFIESNEARPEDYQDRDGYNAKFLGKKFVVPFPKLTENKDDVRSFQLDGETQDVLDYRHFSVLMSISRRMCRFSACNIDGKTSISTTRRGWRFDPRIPKAAQIMKECYGNLPKFSRGHMTRREDPAWGAEADQGNVDSMHVTNAVPQIQPFNGGIWLGLENYALHNSRKDDQKISVFTGPFLESDDPIRFKVKVPVIFWKVIAFIHDDTGKLTATGYTMSQKSFIGDNEFVFGQHEHHQRPIAEIEARAGISFGPLANVDPLRDDEESLPKPLMNPDQIRWV